MVAKADLAYVLSGMPSSMEVTASEVGSETGEWNCYCG